MLSLCVANSFLNRFDSISKKNKYNCFFIYTKFILSLYLINTIVAKTIVIFIVKKLKIRLSFIVYIKYILNKN